MCAAVTAGRCSYTRYKDTINQRAKANMEKNVYGTHSTPAIMGAGMQYTALLSTVQFGLSSSISTRNDLVRKMVRTRPLSQHAFLPDIPAVPRGAHHTRDMSVQ